MYVLGVLGVPGWYRSTQLRGQSLISSLDLPRSVSVHQGYCIMYCMSSRPRWMPCASSSERGPANDTAPRMTYSRLCISCTVSWRVLVRTADRTESEMPAASLFSAAAACLPLPSRLGQCRCLCLVLRGPTAAVAKPLPLPRASTAPSCLWRPQTHMCCMPSAAHHRLLHDRLQLQSLWRTPTAAVS